MNRLISLAAVAVVAVIALLALDSPSEPVAPELALISAAVGNSSDFGSTWYCAAAGAGIPSPVAHEVVVANPTDRELDVRFTTSAAGANPPVSRSGKVAARSQLRLDPSTIVADAGSVTVEVLGGGAAVSHRLTFSEGFDDAPCVTTPEPTWYFPAADTEKGSSVQLWVYNPFGTDTSFDVTIYSNDAVREPPALSGLVVEAHGVRMVELGTSVERRDQFAFGLTARGGRVVAEMVQTSDGSERTDGTRAVRGLRIGRGIARRATQLQFADGLVGSGSHERYVLFNPSDTTVEVQLWVLPYGASAINLPEPIQVEVAARHFGVVDVDNETRVLPDVPHSVIVDVTDGPGIVASRLLSIAGGGTGGADGAGVKSGLSGVEGSPVAATSWLIPDVDPPSSGRSLVSIRNTSSSGIAQVKLSGIAAGSATSLIGDTPIEVSAGGSLLVDLAVLAQQSMVFIESTQPIVVEYRTARDASKDFSAAMALPLRSTMSAFADYQPPADAPDTTVPDSTAPATEPGATDPAATVPAVTEPPVTEPPATAAPPGTDATGAPVTPAAPTP